MGVKDLQQLDLNKLLQAHQAQLPAAKIMSSLIPPPTPPEKQTPEFSIVTCSINDEKFAQMCATYKIAMAGESCEVIRIADAKSLAEGYLRGLSEARGRTIIFSHDDAAPLRPIGSRLRNHLREVDIVAGAGTDRLDGPAWFTAGPPHVFGQVLNIIPGQTDKMLTVYGVPSALVKGIQAFDGFWFACKREVFNTVTFDATVCNSFHMYDVDFSYRAWKAGVRVGVATDLGLCHASSGGYGDPKWKPAADRWMAVYGNQLTNHRPHGFQFCGVTGADPNDMLRIMDDFVERTR